MKQESAGEVPPMEKQDILDILRRVRNVERQVAGIRESLERAIETQRTSEPRARRLRTYPRETEEDLKGAYERLRERFIKDGSRSVAEFADTKSGAFLDRMIVANSLPIPTRRSKAETLEQLVNYLARSVVLRGT